MIRIRSVLSLAALAVMAAAVSLAGSTAAIAAGKPAPSPSPTAAPTATPTPETLDKQIPRLEGVLKATPDDKDAAIQLASDYMQVNRPDLAVQLTQKLLASGTKTAQIYFIDGAAQASMGKPKEGIASMEQAANLEPTNMLVLQALTQMYLRGNRADDADRVAKRAVTFNPTVKDAFENYAFVLIAEKKYDDARTQLEAAAKLDPKDPHPVVLEARVYEEQNAPALAMQLLDRAIAIDPAGPEALVAKAELAGAQHDVKTSIATYQTLLAAQTDDVDKAAVYGEMGKLYAREKQDSDADTTFKKAIDLYGSIPSTHLIYGDYLASKKDNAGALREWTSAAGPNRDNPEALLRLGTAAAQSNDFNSAVTNFKRLTEVAPNDPRSYLLLGQAYMANRKPNDAVNAFKGSYNLAHTPDALIGLAAADQQTRNYNEAIQIYEAVDKNAPDIVKQNPGLLYNLGRAYQATNQSAKAKTVYTRFLGYLKPGTQGYTEVKTLIAAIDHPASSSKPAPKPTATPAPKKKT